MKYAFLLGSNAFVVDQPVINFEADGEMIEIFGIKNLNTPKRFHNHSLIIDTNLTDIDGHFIVLSDEDLNHSSYKVQRSEKRVTVTSRDGDLILDVEQLSEQGISYLSENIINQILSFSPISIIRIKGDFMVGEHHITVNEDKLYVDDDAYSESVKVFNGALQLVSAGLLTC